MSDEEPLTRRAAREAKRNGSVPAESGQGAGVPTTGVPTTEVLSTAVLDTTGAAEREAPKVKRPGFAAIVARHPNAWMFSALGVIFLLLGTGAVFAGAAFGAAAPVTAATSNTPTPEPTRVVPVQSAAASALRTCSIDGAAKDPRLLTFEGSVINVTTGEVLFDRNAGTPAPPASGLKVLTSAAALVTIGPNFRMTTRVFEGSDPGSIVLVGGGDPTLSALPAGVESVYQGAPKLSDLAAQTKAAWETNHPGDPITSVILDANYWSPSDKWDSTWERSEQTIGYHSEVTALMVDGDRANPQKTTSPRSTDPIGRAGSAFVAALNLGTPVTVTLGNATPGKPKLAEVSSQPISTLIGQMLPMSDNTLAEMIARVISKESGGGGTAASLNSIIKGALVNLGFNTTGLTIRDGSGLSASNAVPPLLMAQIMASVSTGAQGLGVIKSALPIAGKTGTLASRFTGDNAVARGHVIAKTGWINTSRTLSGWVEASDGSVLSFAFYALGPVKADAMDALDTVATGLYNCGNNLSNN